MIREGLRKFANEKTTWRNTARTLLLTAMAVCASTVTALAWLEDEAADLRSRSERGWAHTLGFDPDEIPRRFPKRGRNEAAGRVDAFVARLRLTHAETRELWHEVAEDEMIEKWGDATGELNEPARRFLDRHAGELDAFYRSVLAGEEPRWEVDLALRSRAPVPNALAAASLTNAIAADALYKASRGEHAGALTAVEAAWKVNAGYRARPDVVSQLIASSLDGVLVCVLRKIDGVPPEWADRVVADDRRRGLYVALGVEAWMATGEIESRAGGRAGDGPGPAIRVTGAIAGPYLRFCAVESSSAMQAVVAELERRWPGTIYSESLPSDIFECSWWNPWAPEPITVTLAHGMVGRYLLLADTTRAVLRAKQMRSAGAGRAQIGSAVIGGASWSYDPGVAPATFTLRFSRPEELECRGATERFRAIVWAPAD